MKEEGILIIDFGSQYVQLIARRIRENHAHSLVVPPDISMDRIRAISPRGIVLSGGPSSVYDKASPSIDPRIFGLGIPILGICYGMQLTGKLLGGKIKKSGKREYGRGLVNFQRRNLLFKEIPAGGITWMSHCDKVERLPMGFRSIAKSGNTRNAAFADIKKNIYGVQFHPEVIHTENGKKILKNFLFRICGCKRTWTMKSFIENKVKEIRERVGNKDVILGLSGGVDSTVCAVLLHRALGKKVHCIFVDNGLLRKNEVKRVKTLFAKNIKLDLKVVDARKEFLKALKGVRDPEKKRKIIGRSFIKVFERTAKKIKNVSFLAQGTLYPDVIESRSFFGGPSKTIKSHHNVGGLPRKMGLKLVEPLRDLFKDEVREAGRELGLPVELTQRQPFPGPGLAVRILGEVRENYLEMLRKADWIIIDSAKKCGIYYKTWQIFGILLPVKSVGVMGDTRTYENTVGIRAVTSVDGMTADWARLPHSFLETVSSRIINEVNGINRVVYDISSKPPSTIEWE